MKMKSNDCKLCESLDNQKISGEKACRHHMQTSVTSAATAALLSSPHYFRDFLAFHILKGYYQPAGPLISGPHLIPPQSIPQPLESDQTQSTQSTSSSATDNVDPDVMITGGDLAPRPPYRYGPHPPPPDYSRPPLQHQMHPYPTYPYHGYPYAGHPPPPPLNHQELCYPPYYPPKYFQANSPYPRRYLTSNYYPPLDFRPPQAVPQNPQPQILSPSPAPPQHIDPYTNSPYYTGYSTNAGGQCYSSTQPRNLQPPFLDAPHFHTTSCPCPKNALTGTGLTINNNGPVSASKTAPASSSSIVTSSPANNICKIENILSPNVTIKPENKCETPSASKPMELFSHVAKLALEQPETTSSPARGSTGLQIPAAVQPEASIQHPDLTRLHHLHHYQQPTYIMTSMDTMTTPLEISKFKQEFIVKKETNVDSDVNNVNYGNLKPIENFKVERLEKQTVPAPTLLVVNNSNNDPLENMACNESNVNNRNKVDTVNLIHESGDDECIDYTMKRHNSSVNDDVIELSDNSLMDPPTRSSTESTTSSVVAGEIEELSASAMSALNRRKLLAMPVNIPKKSPPNSYKSLIKSANGSTSTTPVKGKKTGASLKRRSILKPKSAVLKKKIRMTKKRFLLKKKMKSVPKVQVHHVDEEKSSSSFAETNEDDKSDDVSANESTEVQHEKSDGSNEETSSSSSMSEKNVEFNEDSKSVDETSDSSGKSNIDETIDRVAKGYFSESEILTTLSKFRKKKIEKQIKQKISKAEEKRKKTNGKRMNPTKGKKDDKKNKNQIQESEKKTPTGEKKKAKVEAAVENHEVMKLGSGSKSKKPIKKDEKPSKKQNIVETEFVAVNDDFVEEEVDAPPKQGNQKKQQKSTKSQSTAQKTPKKTKFMMNSTTSTAEIEEVLPTPPPTVVESDEDDAKMTSIDRDEETSTTVLSSSINTNKSILDETDVANNNNECFENNNQMNDATSETAELEKSDLLAAATTSAFMRQEPLTLYKTPGVGWTTLVKTKRGKKSKFGNRKKQKVTLLNDIVIPRCTSTPRWSNGWTWVGEPFQAYVFLDSDNPPVPRTCYEAMRHEECGDVIRPRDCVLLRAGGKKNELPYVAKVAQLWENPEDGEMMMSLFWYYRPEHTEQGRQEADAGEEVFASRHKDHNSVACIEDKCYVLTYNEYCRYRRVLKMFEENLDEQPSSLVPRLVGYHDRRPVPQNTSPELVMFCRRVYDFRAKRLVEDKNRRK